MMDNYYNYMPDDMYRNKPSHTHEFYGTTGVGEAGRGAHTHRVAGVSSKPVIVSGGHIHEIATLTTFEDGHVHQVTVRTGLQIPVGGNQHVHSVKGMTTLDDNHTHKLEAISLAGQNEM